jgi:OHCU decarboxylase
VSRELERLNALPAPEAEARFEECCASSAWARRMTAARPFTSFRQVSEEADRIWRSLSKEDWLEAFVAHPKIGSSPPNSEGSGRFHAWSREEQGGTRGASPETLANLADANRDYEERFGHIFIVCASGRNAAEMLALAQARLGNDRATELAIAAEEQRKITRLRLEKLLARTDK